MPYVVIEAYAHDGHTDRTAYITANPPEPAYTAFFKRWIVFFRHEAEAYACVALGTITCGGSTFALPDQAASPTRDEPIANPLIEELGAIALTDELRPWLKWMRDAGLAD